MIIVRRSHTWPRPCLTFYPANQQEPSPVVVSLKNEKKKEKKKRRQQPEKSQATQEGEPARQTGKHQVMTMSHKTHMSRAAIPLLHVASVEKKRKVVKS